MKEQIKRILKWQIVAFILVWALPLVYALLHEAGVLSQGALAGDARMEYIFQTIGILMTIVLIPFALRIFNLNLVKRIQELPLQKALKSYRIWADVRLALLVVPALINLQFYYLTLNNTGLFCAAMSLVASLFCVPSESRIKNELDLPENLEE